MNSPNPQAADTGVSAEVARLMALAHDYAIAYTNGEPVTAQAVWLELEGDLRTALLAGAAGGKAESVEKSERVVYLLANPDKLAEFVALAEANADDYLELNRKYSDLVAAPPPPVGAPQGVSDDEIALLRARYQSGEIGSFTALVKEIAASRQGAGALPALTCPRSNRSDCALFDTSPRPSKEWYAQKIAETEGLDSALPCGALATPSPAQAEPTDEELLGNFRVGGHEAPTYWPHGDDRATPGPMSIADIVKVAGIAGLKASQLLAKLKAAGFDVTLNQPLAPDHVAALLVMPLATGAAEGAEPTADAERDVLAERRRQIEGEGWTEDHDNQHNDGDLAKAAACYALHAAGLYQVTSMAEPPTHWPWSYADWKPKDFRRDLVRAAALMIAEIAHHDAARAAQKGQP